MGRSTDAVAAAQATGLLASGGLRVGAAALADLDGDGDADLVIGADGNGDRFYRNDGSGGFHGSGIVLWPGIQRSESLRVGDIDGDGHADVVAARFGTNDLLYRNLGNGSFAAGEPISSDRDMTRALAVGDVDGDGDLDLAFGGEGINAAASATASRRVSKGNEGPVLRLYLNDGDGGFPASGTPVGTIGDTHGIFDLAFGDLDGDGDLDLVAARQQRNRVFLNDGSGQFDTGTPLGVETDQTLSIALGDVDGDGDLDIVAGNPSRLNRLYRNDGSAGFPAVGEALGAEVDATSGVALVDIDGDGDLDLLVANRGADDRLYLNDGDGLFPTVRSIGESEVFSEALLVGDLDRDGDADVFFGNRSAPSRVYFNDGFGGLASEHQVLLYGSREAFLRDIDAGLASAPYAIDRNPVEPFTSGQVELAGAEGSRLDFSTWPADFPDDNDIELALFGTENLDVRHLGGPIHALGFEFDDPSGGSTPSTFTLTALKGDVPVARLSFDTPRSPPPRDFIGLWSELPFDRIELRETSAANENEYIGAFYVSAMPPPPIERRRSILQDPGAAAGQAVGHALASSDGRLLVSAPPFPSAQVGGRNAFHVRGSDGRWRLEQGVPSAPGDARGRAVALAGEVAVLAEYSPPALGGAVPRVHYLRRGPAGWQVEQVFGTADDIGYISAVAVSEGRVFIGMPFDTEGDYRGSVQIFEFSGPPADTWELTTLRGIDDGLGGGGERFGTALAVQGDRLFVGATGSGLPGSGRVAVFLRRGPADWVQEPDVKGLPSQLFQDFGAALAVEGDLLIVGAPGFDRYEHDHRGAVYLFQRQPDGQWTSVDIIHALPGEFELGWRVTLASGRGLLGIRDDRSFGGAVGSARVVEPNLAGQWVTSRKLLAGNADFFASGLAAFAGGWAVGAPVKSFSRSSPLLDADAKGRVYLFSDTLLEASFED
ncbi:FG-GAP repeat domain-containing protein [Pseudomarimonas salicorniae]|uniref:VCBS repeat-containing protein n=1 Tax=Pseudomarimonas salicorniae TaxID=2933270 RepID=A0ABT0GKH2_9GAMM|nr:VCBS repeat-containing protein [Lysobacter sp. CAU 1642]